MHDQLSPAGAQPTDLERAAAAALPGAGAEAADWDAAMADLGEGEESEGSFR